LRVKKIFRKENAISLGEEMNRQKYEEINVKAKKSAPNLCRQSLNISALLKSFDGDTYA
jgi:hypothetical protein